MKPITQSPEGFDVPADPEDERRELTETAVAAAVKPQAAVPVTADAPPAQAGEDVAPEPVAPAAPVMRFPERKEQVIDAEDMETFPPGLAQSFAILNVRQLEYDNLLDKAPRAAQRKALARLNRIRAHCGQIQQGLPLLTGGPRPDPNNHPAIERLQKRIVIATAPATT